MRNCRALMQMLFGLVALGGVCGAESTSLTLSVPVTPDINDKVSRWEYRVTTTYDAINNRYFTGAVERGAGEYAISMFTQSDTGATLTKAGLTPVNIYSDANDTASALVANPLYDSKVWEMDCFENGGEVYVAAIMQLSGETGVGGSVVAVIKASDPKETYISGAAMTLDGEAAGTANTASKFVKLITGMLGSAATRVVFAAVADSVTGEFDSSKATVGLRAYRIPATISDYSLTEVDMLSGTGKGVPLGASATLNDASAVSGIGMSPNMRKLTSMAYDPAGKILYLGGYMKDSTLGLFGFYLNGSDVMIRLNHATYGTLLNGDASSFPELSRIHHMRIQSDGTNSHLILHAGSSSREQSNFYALSLATGAAGTLGRLAQGNTFTSVAAGRSTMWINNATNGVYSGVGQAVVGNAPFPLAPGAVITGMAVVGNVVYVSTWNAALGTSDVWKATATIHASHYVSSWTGWQNLANTTLNNVTALATNGTYAWAVLDRYSVYVNSAIGTSYAQVQPSLGLANIKSSASRTRLRKLAAFDSVNRQFVLSANGTPDGHSMSSVHNYTVATGANAAATEAANVALANLAIWDSATITHGGVTDRYYLIQDDATTPKPGGSKIVKVSGADGTVTSIQAGTGAGTAFFKDGAGTPVASKCFKIVAGTKTDGTPVLFCLIPDADNKDNFAGFNADETLGVGAGNDDIIKVLDADLGVIAASVLYQDCVGSQTGNITSAQCAYFDSTLSCLFIGAQKSSGNDPGLAFVYLTGTTFSQGLVVPSGQSTNNTIKDAWQIASLHTPADGGTSRSILIVAGTQTGDAGDTNTGGVYALPLMPSGANLGKAARADYTTVVTNSATTWDTSTRPDLFTVGGTPPWNAKAAVVDIQVVGQDVYVTVANPPGIVGQAGVFVTTAVSAAGALIAWTPWAPVSGLSSSMQNVAFDATSGKVIGLDLASGAPAVASWKTPGTASSFDKLAAALNADFASNGGVYNLSSHTMVEGISSSNSVGTGASANLIVATGNKKVALGHVQYRTSAGVNAQYNPDASNIYGYKLFSGDDALNAIGNIYCSTVSRGTAGWVFVGGEAGIGVLRVPGARAGASHSGEGWTGAVPKDLMDTTSTTSALASMTWYQLPGITGPIYSMTTVYDKTATTETVIAVGKGGIYAFAVGAAKFADITPASLGLTTLSVLSATSGASERMWCVEPLYRGKGVFAVGTTLGMYLAQVDGGVVASLAEVVDGDGNSLGPVASIAATRPIVTASTNPRYTIDCVTARARTDASKHYRTNVSFVYATGAISGTYVPSLITTLDRMTTQILNNVSVNTYVATVPNRMPASLSALANSLEGAASPVSDGLTLPSGVSSMGRAAIVGCDGSRLVTVDGRVYVRSV